MDKDEIIKNIIRIADKNSHIKFEKICYDFNSLIQKLGFERNIMKYSNDELFCFFSSFHEEFLYKGYLLLRYITDDVFKNDVDLRNPFHEEFLILSNNNGSEYIMEIYDPTKFEPSYEEYKQHKKVSN